MSYRSKLLLLGFFVCAGCVPHGVFAATLYIDPHSIDVLKGDLVTVAVRLNTDEGECVNAVDAVITYSDSIEAVDISRGKSIMSLWVEDPVLNKDAHQITFAGGIPNGYCGRIPGDPSLTNIVAELVFRAPGFSVGRKDNVAALVSFDPKTRVLLNDGQGTDAPLRTIDGNINLLQQVGTTTKDEWGGVVLGDKIPPQPFSIDLVKNPQIFQGKYYIVFNTTDKQTGVDHYEVLEESEKDFYNFSWGRTDAPWVKATSPFLLKDQTLHSVIRVKAIDKAGNEQVAVVVPDASLRTLPVFVKVLGILGAFLLMLCVAVVVRALIKRRRRVLSEDDEITPEE